MNGNLLAARLSAPLLLLCASGVGGQNAPLGVELTLTSEVDELSDAMASKLADTLFEAMFSECAELAVACPTTVNLNVVPSIPDCAGFVEPGACTEGNTITVNFKHLKVYPSDMGLVTHEAMHLLQTYSESTEACSYWAEGLADFARDRYGDPEANRAVSWSLKQGNSYTDSYDKTGHFLRWVGEQYALTTVVALHNQLKTSCPDDAFWNANTGLGLDELWTTYASGTTRVRSRVSW